MTVFDFPPQALAETGCFSVLSRCGAEELFIVPPRALPVPPERLPITPRTLVPEYLADRFPENPVMVSSQLCGGTLEARLQSALARWGERVWLLCEPLCARLPLPCPDAQETRLSQAEMQAVRAAHPFLYTPAFCCDYAADPEHESLYLHDSPQTIKRKLTLAAACGISHTLCLPQA